MRPACWHNKKGRGVSSERARGREGEGVGVSKTGSAQIIETPLHPAHTHSHTHTHTAVKCCAHLC